MTRPRPESPAYLSTDQVAKAVGVSVTTIKRWVDDGILPAHKTPGGHRKLVLADVLRLTREGDLPPADAGRLVRADSAEPDTFCDQLIEAVRHLDGGRIRAVVLAAYRANIPMAVLGDRVVAPAMRFVGGLWERNHTDVATEHRVTQAVVAALYELRGQLLAHAARERPTAVGGAPEGDHYILPTLLAKLTLAEAGWNAVNLGPNTPAEAFLATIKSLKPKLVWVSVSNARDTFEAEYREVYRAAAAGGVAVAVGGRGLTPELRGRLPYTTFGDGMTHLAAFARSLHPRPQRPKRGRPPKRP